MANQKQTNDASYPWLKTYPKNIKWDMDIKAKPVYEIFDDAAETFAERPAFDFLGKKYLYKDLKSQIIRVAAGLQEMGVKKGDKVGLFLPNSPYFIIAYYAILKTGATVVNFNPLYGSKEVEYQINDSDTSYMFTLDLEITYPKLIEVKDKTTLKKIIVCPMSDILTFPKNVLFPIFKRKDMADISWDSNHVYWDDLLQTNHRLKTPVIDVENDVAVLQYTGGTTGVPKGAMLTHKNVYSNTVQSLSWFTGVRPGEDKMLGVLPFFHVFAMIVVLNLAIKAGMEIIALPRFDLKDALKAINDKKPTLFPAVPAIYSSILNYKNLNKYNLSSIRFCISGGAPLPVDTKVNFEKITGCYLAEGYGLTESSPVASCNPLEGVNKKGSIGLPLPNTIIEIVSPEDQKTIMPRGESGELCIRGPQVMKGYYKREEETAKTIINGRLHTGDVAFIDEDGYTHIIDRIKDMIITNGYNVYPRNIEEAIYAHPDVEECIVGGLPDPARGEIVKAWIKLKDKKTLTVEELKAFLEDKVSSYEMPRKFEFRTKPLPKTMIGKLSRKDVIAEEKAKKPA